VGIKNNNTIEINEIFKFFFNMEKRKESLFLFMEKIPLERIEWLAECFHKIETEGILNQKNSMVFNGKDQITFFLTGDALFSLIDKRYQESWLKLISKNNFQCYLDSEELSLLGLKFNRCEKYFPKKEISRNKPFGNLKIKKESEFWYTLINATHAKNYGNQIGFLEFQGPYMSRTSVNAVKFLESAIDNNLNPKFITYLDGVHIGHLGQRPSEFENIGKKLVFLNQKAKQNNLNFKMLSCSRCGTARGHIREPESQKYIQSDDVIPNYMFCNLNRIIDEYEKPNLILAPSWGSVQFFNEPDQKIPDEKISKPSIIVFITHSPYGSEWTFGGLSFAMACANHEIPTELVFIEDGAYCLPTKHKVTEENKIFNIQDIIMATSDMEFLNYYVFEDSLKLRNLDLANNLNNNIEKINNLGGMILSRPDQSITHKRIIFY